MHAEFLKNVAVSVFQRAGLFSLVICETPKIRCFSVEYLIAGYEQTQSNTLLFSVC